MTLKTASSIAIFTSTDIHRFLAAHPEKKSTIEQHFLTEGPGTLVKDLKTESIVISTGKQTLFATVNHKEYGNTHICSPYGVYIGSAKAAVKNFDSQWVKICIHLFTHIFGSFFKGLKLNKVIQLNNTLATVNLHPREIAEFAPEMIKTLITQYPHHAIIWPRLTLKMDAELYALLEKQGFSFIPTKTVHLYDIENNYMKIKTTKRDFSVLKQSDYKIVSHDELTEIDIDRIQALYEMLFIEKHDSYSPHFTKKYFQHCHQFRWFELTALRNSEGIIDAFCSQRELEGMMVCGPSGYDTTKPSKLGLYRMIIWLNLNKAHEAKCLYNMGSGNELYKLNRGSTREIEYNAVYYRHLPFYRRLPWKILQWAGQNISLKIFKKHLL